MSVSERVFGSHRSRGPLSLPSTVGLFYFIPLAGRVVAKSAPSSSRNLHAGALGVALPLSFDAAPCSHLYLHQSAIFFIGYWCHCLMPESPTWLSAVRQLSTESS